MCAGLGIKITSDFMKIRWKLESDKTSLKIWGKIISIQNTIPRQASIKYKDRKEKKKKKEIFHPFSFS